MFAEDLEILRDDRHARSSPEASSSLLALIPAYASHSLREGHVVAAEPKNCGERHIHPAARPSGWGARIVIARDSGWNW